MAKEKLTKKELRERQAAAGRATAGPRRKPDKGDRVSENGYRQPGRYKGIRNAERNRKIIAQLAGGASVKQVASRNRLSPITVEQIKRYYKEAS